MAPSDGLAILAECPGDAVEKVRSSHTPQADTQVMVVGLTLCVCVCVCEGVRMVWGVLMALGAWFNLRLYWPG